MDEDRLHAILREYLDPNRAIRELERDVSSIRERLAKLEATKEEENRKELSDSANFHMGPGGPVRTPWGAIVPMAPPMSGSLEKTQSTRPSHRHDSVFPRILLHLTDPRVLVVLSAAVAWLIGHFTK